MKILLSLLLSFLFLNAQVYALNSNISSNGGPNYGTLGNINGTYAGVLTPASGAPTNALGLFDLVLKSTGIGSGSFLVFENGLSFSGTIDALGDPNSQAVKGILQASFFTKFFNTFLGVTQLIEVEVATANGALQAVTSQASGGGSSFGTSLTGTATVTVVAVNNNFFFNNSVNLQTGTQEFLVDGFQQSASTASVPAIVSGT